MRQIFPHDQPATLPVDSRLVAAVVVGVLYFLLAGLSLGLSREVEVVAVFWPAAGLAAGVMVALPRNARTFVPFAILAATVAANLHARDSFGAAFVFGICNAGECVLFCLLLEKIDGSGRRLESLGSVAAFLVAACISAAIAALGATVAIHQLGLSAAVPLQIWLSWFQSDVLGIIALAPVLIALPSIMRDLPRRLVVAEGLAGVAITPIVTFGAFSLVYSNVLSAMSPRFALLPLFLWLAARTPAVFPATSAFLMSVVMVFVALNESGGTGEHASSTAERLTSAKVAILSGCLVLMALTAMFARLRNQAAALHSSDRRLRLALEAGHMYAFEYDHVTGTTHRVGGLVERLGLPVHGGADDFFAVLHGDDKNSFEGMYSSVSPAQPKSERLIRMRGKSGEILLIEHRSEVEFDERGALLRLYGTCVDVTELKAQSEELRAALQAGRVYAFEYDVVKGTARRSDNAAEILGVPLETARTSNSLIFDLVHPEDRKSLLTYGRRSISDTTATGTFRFIRPDGRVAWLEASYHATTDEGGKVLSIRGLARDVSDKVRAEQRQELLIRELDHRVKNALARMAVVVELSKEGHQSLDEYVAVIRGRIQSMARTQERLSGSKWAGVGIASLIEDELAAYRRSDNCRIEGPDVLLEPDIAQAFAFTIHELATNAAKYGAFSHASGRVEVTWTVTPADAARSALDFVWRELAAMLIVAPTRESYGLRTIRNLMQYECEASIDLDFPPSGLVCKITLLLGEPGLAADIAAEDFSHAGSSAGAPGLQ